MRIAMRCSSVYLLLLLCMLCLSVAHAQVASGYPTLIPTDSHEVDDVDLLNNNVILRVPGIKKAGTIPFTLTLTANVGMGLGSDLSHPLFEPATVANYGFTGGPFYPNVSGMLSNAMGVKSFASSSHGTCGGFSQQLYSDWRVITPDGATHSVSGTNLGGNGGPSCNTTLTGTTTDGAGISISVTGLTVNYAYYPNGTSIGGLPNPQSTDRNGNSLSTDSAQFPTRWTDSMGLTVLSNTGTIYSPTYTWTDASGGTPGISQKIQPLQTQTNFVCTGITDFAGGPYTMTTGFSFPDGRTMAFTYEPTPGISGSYTGRIKQITLQEGGTVTYTYGGTHNGIDCTYLNPPTLTRTQGNGEVTTYALTHSLISGSNYKAVNTVTDPGGNVTTYQFTGFTSTGMAASPTGQVLTQVVHKLGASTVLETDVYCYNVAYTLCNFSTNPTSLVTLPITRVIVMRQLAGMTTHSATETDLDNYGNVTYTADYDFGSTTPVRATTISYGTWNGSTCVAITNTHVHDRVCESLTTQDGNKVADTRFSRDANGNLTKTSLWNGVSWIGQASLNTYNANGTPTKTYDVANNETDYLYQSAAYTNCGSCTQYPFPTVISNAATGVGIGISYDGRGGVAWQTADSNGQNWQTLYTTAGGIADPYWRPLRKTDPQGNVTTFSYPTGSSMTSSTSLTFNGGNSIRAEVYSIEGYGHLANRQIQQSPTGSNYDTYPIAYIYTGTYRRDSVAAAPCSASIGTFPCPANLWIETDTDPLGRVVGTANGATGSQINYSYNNGSKADVLVADTPAPLGENNKQVQFEKDGLGRVLKVCQIGNGSSTPCGQATGTANGLTDTYAYSSATGSTTVGITRGPQTRSMTYDALGRLTQKVIPEASGTWHYYYDTAACANSGASPGNLTCSTDPNGVTTIYFYDGLNRLHDVNAIGSYCRRFRYDSGTNAVTGTVPTGVTIVNTYGRLVEAETDNCLLPITPITDEWFSYDTNGRMTDQWELTPHSTQYYHSVTTYFEDGTVKTDQLASPSLYTVSYGLDGEGHWNTMAQGSQNIVTGATFFPAANPATINYTGTTPDNDAYTFDTAGRMSKFVFTVGNTPASLTGNLSWNANGTLGYISTTDGFNPANSLTCYSNSNGALGYGYDDRGRLSEFDCGSGNWGQQYSYDNYDNLTKTQLPGHTGTSWTPVYSATNNHCSGCTYDANGDVLSDGNDVYTWDGYGKIASTASSGMVTCGTNGKCPVYDALGRMVETSSGSTWTEWWYTALGRVSMNGITSNYGLFPTPGGNTANISGSIAILHRDWLGSARLAHGLTSHSVSVDRGFTPYGEMYSNYGTGSGQARLDLFAGMMDTFDRGVMWDTPNRELSVVGRWLSPDPAGEGWNAYAYPTDPNSFIDPLGLGSCPAGQVFKDGKCWPHPGSSCLGGHNPNPLCKNSPTNPGAEAWNDLLALMGITGYWQPTYDGGSVWVPVFWVDSSTDQTDTQQPSKCGSRPSNGRTSIVSGNYTTNIPTISAGAAIGGLFGGEPGAFVGGIIGSFFGVGGTVSYVPSTKTLYLGPAVTVGLGVNGGSGASASLVMVPPKQNPNSIAGGYDFSLTYQPNPFLGSTVVKSPGSGPPVVGPSIGTRIPVAGSVSYSTCLTDF